MLNAMEMCQCEFENTVPKIFSPTLSEAVFKEKHGVWDPMPQLTIIYNSVVRYPPPLQRERGEVGKISPIG
jgi:hypothetical protein